MLFLISRRHRSASVIIYIYIDMVAPRRVPPPWYPVMYSYTSISNGRHSVFSPPLPPTPCGTGYPSASAASPSPTAAVLCSAFLRHALPPPLRFCGFPTVRVGHAGRKENPPVEQDGFPFCHTHTHTPCLCECMAILSPNPPSCGTGWFSLLL